MTDLVAFLNSRSNLPNPSSDRLHGLNYPSYQNRCFQVSPSSVGLFLNFQRVTTYASRLGKKVAHALVIQGGGTEKNGGLLLAKLSGDKRTSRRLGDPALAIKPGPDCMYKSRSEVRWRSDLHS